MRKERKIINTNIRLNLCDEQDRQAWEYLQTMDREKYKSYTRAVVVALYYIYLYFFLTLRTVQRKLYENSIVIYFCFSSANRAIDPKRVFQLSFTLYTSNNGIAPR
jgi:hypothetical protein